jgi:aspartate aminotransferase
MLMILQWLETYDLNGETVMVAPAAGFTLPGMGQRIGYVLKKKEDLIRAVQIIKQRYQSITQGKVIEKG